MRRRLLWPAPLLLALLGGGLAVAGEHEHGREREHGYDHDERVPPVADNLVRQECGSCHMAFPPAFLPARSWNALMDGLKDHFGDDVRLSADQTAAIRAYLTTHAGDAAGSGGGRHFLRGLDTGTTPSRITATPFFLRHHAFPERVWHAPQVVTKSNCQACHAAADKGLFEDD